MDIVLNNVTLRVWRNGDVFRKMTGGWWREVANTPNAQGYNMIRCSSNNIQKPYLRHRIIAYCYLGLDLNDTKQHIDHIDHDKSNNDIMNLRIVTNQENHFNRSNVKGYTWEKGGEKMASTYSIKCQKDISWILGHRGRGTARLFRRKGKISSI